MNYEVFDFETVEINNKLYPLCIAYTDNNVVNFSWIKDFSKKEACFFILNYFKNNILYYAHNLLFDYLLIIESIIQFNIKHTWIFLNYNLYEVKLFYNNKTIILRCSHKLIPFSLDQFFPTFSKKKKLFFPYEILSNWNETINCSNYSSIDKIFQNYTIGEYIKIYITQDVNILYEGLNTFFKNLKELKIFFSRKNLSCSSIPFNFYIKKFNKINFDLSDNSKNIINQAYFGGRCEVFGNPKSNEKILHFDFSGMYFNCMKDELPYDEFIFKSKNLNINEPGFYYINVEYYDQYPILPIKTDKLYFKEGKISGWFWYEEIILLLKNKKLNSFELIYGLISTKNDKILLDFLNILDSFKDLDSIKRKLGKLMINSFYGRLAMNNELFSIELTNELGVNKSYGILNDLFIIKKKLTKKTKSNIALAAAIASKARIKLYEAHLEVIKHNGRVLYSDTDSVFASFDNNISVENKYLGKHIFFDTTKKDTLIKNALFISSKSYALKLQDNSEIIKFKGINVKDINYNELEYKFYNNENYITLKNNQFSKKNFSLEHHLLNKVINIQNYNKRVWIDNKTNTKPLTNI